MYAFYRYQIFLNHSRKMSAQPTELQGEEIGEPPLTNENKAGDNVDGFEKGAMRGNDEVDLSLPEGCGLPVAEGGGVLSPLSGAYLLIILSEPMSDQHKSKMIQKLRQGKIDLGI